MDSLAFLSDETETPTAPLAPALAPAAAPQKPAAGPGAQATDEDHSAALERALQHEFARRRWARAEAIVIELEGRRQELEWHQMQSWSRRLMATARGQQALLRGECQRLQEAYRQALARERGLRQRLLMDPISQALISEDAQQAARDRAAAKAETDRLITARADQAARQQETAREREREALRLAQQAERDDEVPRRAKRGAPKPR